MKYRVKVERVEDLGEILDREFDFSESSHKIADDINQVIDRIVAEGNGTGPEQAAYAALEKYRAQPRDPYQVDPREVGHDELFIAGFEAGRDA